MHSNTRRKLSGRRKTRRVRKPHRKTHSLTNRFRRMFRGGGEDPNPTPITNPNTVTQPPPLIDWSKDRRYDPENPKHMRAFMHGHPPPRDW